MEKKKIGINKWVIALAIITVAVLIFECFAIFTDALDLPLSDVEMKEKVIYTYYEGVTDGGFLKALEDVSKSKGDYPLPYKVVSSYSEYKQILKDIEKVSPRYVDKVRACFNDVGYTRAYFSKYSLILIEETPRDYIYVQNIETSGGGLNIYLSSRMNQPRVEQAQLFVVPVSKKVMRNIDEININTYSYS